MEYRELLAEYVRLLKPDTYVEIGVKRGYTFNYLSPRVKRAVAVDIAGTKYIKKFSNVECFDMSSEEFVKAWKDPIDMIFIDGDHKAKSVMRDIELMLPFLNAGTGLMFLHDTHPVQESLLSDEFCSNAWQAAWRMHHFGMAETAHKIYDLEIVTIPGPWAGLSIMRKVGNHHLSWKN